MNSKVTTSTLCALLDNDHPGRVDQTPVVHVVASSYNLELLRVTNRIFPRVPFLQVANQRIKRAILQQLLLVTTPRIWPLSSAEI